MNEHFRNIRRIVIVRLSALGDVLHAVPMAVALRASMPQAHIGWVVEGRFGEVLADHPAVDTVMTAPRGWLKSPSTILRLRRELRAFSPDLVFDVQSLFKSAVAGWLSGAPVRVGFGASQSREGSRFLHTHHVTSTSVHVVERNCELLRAIGIEAVAGGSTMPLWHAEQNHIDAWIREQRHGSRFAVMNPGAGWPSKIWPAERFATVAERLFHSSGIRSVVVWGGNKEEAMAEIICAAAPAATIKAPRTSLRELGSLARRAVVFISSDTGPLHLAAAIGTPCVGLFGPLPATRNGPWGVGHISIEALAEIQPAWHDRKTCMRSILGISVDSVVAAVEQISSQSHAA